MEREAQFSAATSSFRGYGAVENSFQGNRDYARDSTRRPQSPVDRPTPDFGSQDPHGEIQRGEMRVKAGEAARVS
jgi:hypothetical protein